MDKNHKPCPLCGKPMHRQSPRCKTCAMADPKVRQRISKAQIGRPSYIRTEAHRRRMSEKLQGEPKPNLLGKRRPEVAVKIQQWWTPERREAARKRGLALAADPAWRQKIGEAVSGSRNPMWEDGRAQIPYAPGWGRVNRRLIRARQKGLCGKCGERKPLDTHHKDGSKSNHATDNLVGLCRRCHKLAHAELRKKRMNLRD